MNIIKKRLGERLKAIRNLHGYTQETLAEKVGINLRQLARIEAGESFVTSDTLYRICVVLGISPAVLFDFEIEEAFATNTGKYLHFNVIETNNIIKFIPKIGIENSPNSGESFDEKMITTAQKMQQDVSVDKFVGNILCSSKIYTQRGKIQLQETILARENKLKNLKESLNRIVNDRNKIDYMVLAFQSLYNRKALEQFQFLVKGLELSLE